MATYEPVDYDPFAAPEKPKQSFREGMALGLKKRGLGVIELGANAAQSLGADASGLKELIGDVGQEYAKQGSGTGIKGGVAEILGDPLTYLPTGASLAKILGQGALMGATSATGDAQSTLSDNAANTVGGALTSGLGYGAGKVISKVARPVNNTLNTAAKKAIATLESAGVPLSAAQKTGSRALAGLESVFATLPTTSGKQAQITAQQRNAFTRAALDKAGIKADDAGREVLASAAKSFGDEYAALAKNNVMIVDDQLLAGASKAYDDATNGVLGQDASSLVKKVYNDIIGTTGIGPYKGAIDGTVYQKTRSMLTQASQSAKPHEASVLKALRNELDAAFERSLPESQQGLMANINQRYQSFKPIQGAMESVGGVTGEIDPLSLYSKVNVGAPLSDLADAGRNILPSKIPDSGTAQRMMMQNLVTGAGVASAGYGAASDNNYALAAGAALGGPKAAQILYNSPRAQNYLINGMNPLIQKGANAIAGALPRAISSSFSGSRANSPSQPQPAEQYEPVDYDPFAGQPVDYDPFAGQPTTTTIEPLSYNSEQPALADKIKQAESSGNPNAKNPLSTASGLYQFTDDTWRSAVNKWGRKYGVSAKDKSNPEAQTAMVNELLADNARILKAKGIEPTDANLYFAHFMGAPAAAKAMTLLGKNAIAARSFPQAAGANPKVFFDGRRPRTVDEVYELITSKVV